MNEEIKKQKIKKDYHGTDNTLIESTRIETNPEDVSMTSAEKRAYLLGAKDMWEAVKGEIELVKKKQLYPYADESEVPQLMIECMDSKAQQFIDSLEKGE